MLYRLHPRNKMMRLATYWKHRYGEYYYPSAKHLKSESFLSIVTCVLSISCSKEQVVEIERAKHEEGNTSMVYAEGFESKVRFTGGNVELPVSAGLPYRVCVYETEANLEFNGSNDKQFAPLIHCRTVIASSDRLSIKVSCSLAYELTNDALSVEPNKKWVTLDVGRERFVAEVERWGYQPFESVSKGYKLGPIEMPCLVIYHPNNMGPETFEQACEYARRVDE